jgi:CheY-like chemotaxis protein
LRNETILNKAKNAAEEASREKALFLNNMSHELRTPLNGIIGTTYLLKDDDLLPGQQLHVHILDSLSQQMLGLVNNVLDYGKIESGKLELHSNRFSISSFMNKLNTNFQNSFRDKSLTYIDKTDSALDEIEVYADDLRLQQVMSNLVSNALKFTEDGSVTASATLQQLNSETVFIVFSVTDTGMGIEEDLINKIFDSFSQGDSATTRKYGGTGLGLTIASNLVKLFNGTLQVKSEKGKGSCFYFTIQLPLYKDQQKDQFARTPFSTERLQNIQLLLVEDNPVNRMVARKIMEKWDIQITEAVNGKDAMEKFNHCEFDIVLLDLEMPEMDGREAIRQIRTINHKIPAIAFTAAFYENMKQDLLQQGFNDYLLKPFKPEDLYQKLLSLLPS